VIAVKWEGSEMLSIHEMAIQRIIGAYPKGFINVGGFGKAFKKIATQYEFFSEVGSGMRRIPDAWSYVPHDTDEFPGTFTLYEIEDANPLSPQKLKDYADFYFVCDYYDLDIRLMVYDRYGENEREIPLYEYYLLFLFDDVDKRRDVA
jgi:hypothetical protein